MVTNRSSTWTSLVKKSAPMVALYWFENFLLTYWFISEVLPTLRHRKNVLISGHWLCQTLRAPVQEHKADWSFSSRLVASSYTRCVSHFIQSAPLHSASSPKRRRLTLECSS